MTPQAPLDQYLALPRIESGTYFVGVDPGVKGAWFSWRLDQPQFEAWNMAAVEKQDPDPVRRAVKRGQVVLNKVLAATRQGAIVGLDAPVYTGHGYTYGPQCALFAAVQVGLVVQDRTVVPIRSQEARAVLGVKGRGKPGILSWAEPAIGRFLAGNKEERIAIAEAYMLMEAAKRFRGR